MEVKRIMLAGVCMAAMCGCTGQGGTKQLSATPEMEVSDSAVVVNTIMERRSVRRYQDRKVEREKLERIVKCGINAPSGMNKQPWEVRVTDSGEFIDGISEIYKKKDAKAADDPAFKNLYRNAPAVIFVAAPADGSGNLDCGLLGQNMMLAAKAMGLGTCCLGGPIRFMKSDEDAAEYLKGLGFSDGYELLYAIAVGYPDESPEAKPRDESKVRFVEWPSDK